MSKTLLSIVVAIAVLAAAALLYVLVAQNDRTEGAVREDDAVAALDGETITRSELNAYITQIEESGAMVPDAQQAEERAEFERLALDQLINDRLLRSMIQADSELVTDAEVDAGIAELRGQFESAEAFEQQLAALGISDTLLRSEIRQQIAAERYFENHADAQGMRVSDEDVETAYQEIAATQDDLPPFEDVAAQLRVELEQQQLQTLVRAEIERLRAEADIEILI